MRAEQAGSALPGGVVAALRSVRDWSDTPLGPTSGWPAELQAAVETCLPSRVPMLLWWGPQLIQLYNDAYAQFVGAKHPAALGQPAAQCWAEIWDQVGVLAEQVLGGGPAIWAEDLFLLMDRHGYLEETYWTFSYSPVRDRFGAVRGVLVATSDVTGRVLAERRVRTLRDLAGVSVTGSGTVDRAVEAAVHALSGSPTDLPVVVAHLLDRDGTTARLVAARGVPDGAALAPRTVMVGPGRMPEPDVVDSARRQIGTEINSQIGTAIDAAVRVAVRDGRAQFVGAGSGPAGSGTPSPRIGTSGIEALDVDVVGCGPIVVHPLIVSGRPTPVGTLLLGSSPYRAVDADYRAFLELVAGQVAGLADDALAWDAEHQRAERESAVAWFSASLAAAGDVRSILAAGLDGVWALLGASQAAALRHGPAGEELLTRDLDPASPAAAVVRERLASALLGRVGTTTVTLSGMPDGMLIVPDDAVGVALWAAARPGRPFDTEQRSLAELLAGRLGQAVRRATEQARVAAVAEVAGAVAGADTVDEVAELAVARAVAAFDADLAKIALRPGGPAAGDDHLDLIVIEGGQTGEVRRSSLPGGGGYPAGVAARGRRVLLPDAAASRAFSAGMAEVVGSGGCSAWAALPLRSGPDVLGSLTIGWRRPRAFTGAEVELLDAFAEQCAHGLERVTARQVERAAADAARGMAGALQRSLLTVPDPPEHVQVAVRYHPAARGAAVGGDWYDAFTTAGGALDLVVGDVVGHDRDAVAAMGQVRNLLRGLAFDGGGSPAGVLGALDAAMDRFGVGSLATAVLAQLYWTERGRRLRWSNAGHLPPLLVEPGHRARFLDTEPEPLLGLGAARRRPWRRTDHDQDVPDGAVLVFYTDGLVERRGEVLDDGLDRLRQLVDVADPTGLTDPAGLEEFCDTVVDGMAHAGDDDIAVLAVRTLPTPPTLPASPTHPAGSRPG